MVPQLPTGTVTFLFTDVEGSTALWDIDQGMRAALARHDEILRSAIDAGGGYVFTTAGDSFAAAFVSAPDAARSAIAAQEELNAEPWQTAEPLKVRMAVHTGTAEERDGDYFGPAVNRAARLLGVGHGGQILLSQSAAALLEEGSREVLTDLGEHRLKDLTEPERIFQLSEGPGGFPPLRSLQSYPNNLPLQLTTFIGRDDQLGEISALIGEHRLLTLTGVGGSGKTRLALQVAGAVIEQFPDGVWFIELGPVSDPGLVPAAVVDGLGISVRGSTPALDALEDFLSDRRLLLVIDNCEHVLDAAAALAESLLKAAPQARIIATSREGLAAASELLWRVPSLHVGSAGEAWESAADSEATRLFAERATHLQPDFALSEQNVADVASICRRLDGMPLAIELAAAQIRVLPVDQILERLDDRFRLLTGRSRTSLPRQQTLLATVQWSYDLLADPERILFGRLAAFRGGFTLEAAESVCAGGGLDASDVLLLLTHLVDKSLVVAESGAMGPDRFRMLETLRQFSLERLAERDEADQVRRRHARYFLTLADEADAGLETAEMASWLDRLETEHDNLRAALGWLVDAYQTIDALRMTIALSVWFWFVHRHHQEAHQWHELTLAQARDAPEGLLAMAFAKASMHAMRLGQLERATEMADEALRLGTASGDNRAQVISHWTYGEVASQGHYDFATGSRHFTESLRLAEAAHDEIWITRLNMFLGRDQLSLGRIANGVEHARRSLDVARRIDWPMGIAEAAGLLSTLAVEAGDFDQVEELGAVALAIEESLDDPYGVTNECANLAMAARLQGDPDRGLELAREGLTRVDRRIDRIGPVPLLLEVAANALAMDRGAEAVEAILDALDVVRDTIYKWTAGRTVSRAATILLSQGEAEAAVTAFAVGERLFEESIEPVRWNLMEFERGLADARASIGIQAFNQAWEAGRSTPLPVAVDQIEALLVVDLDGIASAQPLTDPG